MLFSKSFSLIKTPSILKNGEICSIMKYNVVKVSNLEAFMLNEKIRRDFIAILREELRPAMGCTEPIALAYASAKGRAILGDEPDRIIAKCSGNIIKNVRCVRIPNSDGMTGVEAACALGALAGNPESNMQVLEGVTHE